jgi:hypothetical protein
MITTDGALDDRDSHRIFLLLICTQAAHSIEEYVFRLYEVFAPARAVSGVFSDDPRTGFAVANTLLVAFGFWCYFARMRPAHRSATMWMWGWAVLEGANGLGHITIAAGRGEYFPGVFTAPVLLLLAILLSRKLARIASVME